MEALSEVQCSEALREVKALYKKLYAKYTALKATKISQLDTTEDVEKNFKYYLTASDAYVEQLSAENENLRANFSDLQKEVISLRTQKDQKYEDSQKLLSEERQKNEELTKKIDHMLKLQLEDENQNQETETPKEKEGRKRRRLSEQASVSVSTERVLRSNSRHSEVSEPSVSVSKEIFINVDHPEPQFCRSSNDSGSCNCLNQVLVECLTGMKITRTDSQGICVLHESSGYSFKLMWLKKTKADETQQLLYEVSSLGTFERIAPEWMREVIIFTTLMCPLFFQRLSRVIKNH